MTSMGNIKSKILLTIMLCLIVCSGCKETEYVYLDVAPKLEIMVKDLSDNIIAGATINLYSSEEDFDLKKNEVQTKTTDDSGKALFEDLSESIYYFLAEKGELNNYYEVVTFTNPLKKNEIKTITCIIR